ncbi:RNA methyltransferase, partial [Klebsiella pneumoniae]
ASKDDLHRFFTHLESTLDEASYFHPPEKRDVLVANLRTMLTKAGFTEPEVRTLRGFQGRSSPVLHAPGVHSRRGELLPPAREAGRAR